MRYITGLSICIIFMLLVAGCVVNSTANTKKIIDKTIVVETVEPPVVVHKSVLSANPIPAPTIEKPNDSIYASATLAYGEYSSNGNSIVFKNIDPNATPIVIVPTLDPNSTPQPTETVTPTPTSNITPTQTVTPTTSPTSVPTAVPTSTPIPTPTPIPTQTPNQPVKLIFLHHSSGENWLADSNGGLGKLLMNNNYFVSDTNYGWGSQGDYTDIGDWWTWFRGPDSTSIMSDVYTDNEQRSSYSRLSSNPGGNNKIVMFKSCYPNSALKGNVNDPIPSIGDNPLRGESSGSSYHTISNAKGIYIDLLNYFKDHQDTLFVVITAPPLSDDTYSANARAFNLWLVNEWLKDYPYRNVAVFDFYNVLTTNGGSSSTNDANSAIGNHHRISNGAVQHTYDGMSDTLAYYSGDDHPSSAGNKKATTEFVPYLNYVYNRWKGTSVAPTVVTPTPTSIPTPIPTSTPVITDGVYGIGGYSGLMPIGGGSGYSKIVTSGDYTVNSLSTLKTAISQVKSGQTIFVSSDAVIDFASSDSITIPAGVTLASDRGYNGHAGALLRKSRYTGTDWRGHMITIGGNNVRVTGLQLEGEMYAQDAGGGDSGSGDGSGITGPGAATYLIGVGNYGGYTGLEVDNNEMRGWAYAAVLSEECPTIGRPWIHNNYIHHNEARGEGYGTELFGGDALVEANIYNYNRHDITGTGVYGEKYEFRYNLIYGGGYAIGACHVDVHESETRIGIAGDKYLIHHNTVIQGDGTSNQQPFIHIRDIPTTGTYAYNNDIGTYWGTGTNNMGIRKVIFLSHSQTVNVDSFRFYATDNKWNGKVYAGNDPELIWTVCGSGTTC